MDLPDRLKQSGVAMLSARQQEVLVLLLDGKTEKEIARKMGLSPHTVHNHISAIHQKLAVSSNGKILAKIPPPAAF